MQIEVQSDIETAIKYASQLSVRCNENNTVSNEPYAPPRPFPTDTDLVEIETTRNFDVAF